MTRSPEGHHHLVLRGPVCLNKVFDAIACVVVSSPSMPAPAPIPSRCPYPSLLTVSCPLFLTGLLSSAFSHPHLHHQLSTHQPRFLGEKGMLSSPYPTPSGISIYSKTEARATVQAGGTFPWPHHLHSGLLTGFPSVLVMMFTVALPWPLPRALGALCP